MASDVRSVPNEISISCFSEDVMPHKADAHCTFCDIIHGAGEVSLCYEDVEALAFMDIQPVNPGHVLIVPRRHYESLEDTPLAVAMHLFRIAMKIDTVIRQVTGAPGTNIVVNSGSAAGQDVLHYHVHVIPRRTDDGFDIPLPFPGSDMPDRTMLDAMAARLMSVMRDPMRRATPKDVEAEASDASV